MAVKTCTRCGNPAITEHRYGDPTTVDSCAVCVEPALAAGIALLCGQGEPDGDHLE